MDTKRQALIDALSTIDRLSEIVADYEATGDHDHGKGPVIGRTCPGGDCLVSRARILMARIES